MSDMRYYDGTTWQSLKGADGSGGLSESEVNALIDAALDPYLLISDFNNIIANYATKADLANYMTVAQADGRYVRLEPGGAAQKVRGPLDIVGDMTTGRTIRLWDDAINYSGQAIAVEAGILPNLVGIRASHQQLQGTNMLIEPYGNNAQLQLGSWDQANEQTLFTLTRYVSFTRGLLNNGVPATCRMDTLTGQMWAGDFIAERGVETLRGHNQIRGTTFFGRQGETTSEANSLLTLRPGAVNAHFVFRGVGMEMHTTLQQFTNSQVPLQRRSTDNIVGYFTSSRRFKQDIRHGADMAQPVLEVEPVYFYFNEDLYEKGDPHYEQMGFIAEDVVDKFGPGAGVYGPKGEVMDYSERPLLAGLVALCQRQEAEIADLQHRLATLEQTVAALSPTQSEG